MGRWDKDGTRMEPSQVIASQCDSVARFGAVRGALQATWMPQGFERFEIFQDARISTRIFKV